MTPLQARQFSPCRRYSVAHVVGLALVLCPGLGLAHYPWMTPAEYSPQPGTSLAFEIGWGHAFPGVDTLESDRLASIELLDSTGQVQSISIAHGDGFVTPPLPGTGPWILGARQASGYYSRTPRGGQRGSRAQNPDAMSCGYSSNSVKALLQAHAGAAAMDQPLGHPLEIVPLATDPVAAQPFPVRILYNGLPWVGEVQAAYAGFEGAEGQYPVTISTDAEGVARLVFDRAGRWMIKASASEAYPDPATCDRSNYNATFTLVVR